MPPIATFLTKFPKQNVETKVEIILTKSLLFLLNIDNVVTLINKAKLTIVVYPVPFSIL